LRRSLRVLTVAMIALVSGAMFFSSQRASAGSSASELAPVDVVAVSGLIDDVVVHEIEQALERSLTNGAQAIIFQVNSRGAVVSPEKMARLLESISASPTPIAVWVGPSGARAYGLAAQILAVADVTAMAPGARIGFTGPALQVGGQDVSFGTASVLNQTLLQTSSLGFADARSMGVLKNAGSDAGVPVVRNMIDVLDGLTIDGKTLSTTVEALDGDGQVLEFTVAVADAGVWYRDDVAGVYRRHAEHGANSICHSDYRSRMDDWVGGRRRHRDIARRNCQSARSLVARAHESRDAALGRFSAARSWHRRRDPRCRAARGWRSRLPRDAAQNRRLTTVLNSRA